MKTPFSDIPEVIEALTRGEMVIVCDDEDREGEGDLTVAAEFVTPEDINFMATYGRGLICLVMSPEMVERLGIPDMVQHNTCRTGTAFTASIDAAAGITTGISAADRARTIQVAVDPQSAPTDLVMPGHVFPLKARARGVLARAGHTEAAVDLARLAGLRPASVSCEIMKDDGAMVCIPDLRRFAVRHGLEMISVGQIAEYRCACEKPVLRAHTLGTAPEERG